ncbi:MAG: AraC family transcriptional regulator [Rubrivivax sp.]|nr:MAG: AraC family transcriptional regulator [Rubrivivax sp.]
MRQPSLTSPTRYIHLLCRYVEQEGLDCSAVLAEFELDRQTLAHPETQLAPVRALGLFRALASKVACSELGLMLGKTVNFGALGDVGRAMLSSATTHEALLCCADFYPLVSPSFTVQVKQSAAHLELCWLPLRPVPYDFMCLAFDMTLSAVDTLLTTLEGDHMRGYDVYFTSPPPTHAGLYGRLTKARCHFDVPGMPCLRIHLDHDLLKTPSPLHSPAELAILRKRLTQRLSQMPIPGSWTAWVSMMLKEAHCQQPSMDMLASIVQVSSSTLSRHLAAEGTSFRELGNQIRHSKARGWLEDGQLSVSEIAERLGYANLPSFVRAFKAQSGCSPTQYARANAPSP